MIWFAIHPMILNVWHFCLEFRVRILPSQLGHFHVFWCTPHRSTECTRVLHRGATPAHGMQLQSWRCIIKITWFHGVLPTKLSDLTPPEAFLFSNLGSGSCLVGMALHHLKPDRKGGKGGNAKKAEKAKKATVPGSTHRFRMVPEKLHPNLAGLPLDSTMITSMMLVSKSLCKYTSHIAY